MRWIILLCGLLLISCTVQAPCEVISKDNSHALNVILFQDGFNETRFEELTDYVKETILDKNPFTNKPYINFYHIKNNNTSICMQGPPKPLINAYAGSAIRPLECDVEAIRNLANNCGVEKAKIIILTDDDVASQTSITYDESGVMFLDMKSLPPEIIQHEFVHFFGLVDEGARIYSHALGPGREQAPNCVDSEFKANYYWKELYPENHSWAMGCAGHPEYYKPEYGTIMERQPDLSEPYGVFNEWYLGEVMDCCYAKNRERNDCELFFENYPEWVDCRE